MRGREKEKTSAKYGMKSGLRNSAKREKPSAKNGVDFGEKTIFIYIFIFKSPKPQFDIEFGRFTHSKRSSRTNILPETFSLENQDPRKKLKMNIFCRYDGQ